jgi:predicted Rossmann fold flavoprotein
MLPIVIIGGGAAGFFGAINVKLINPHVPVILVEKTQQLLAKVRISGGGRCNVTHSCFDAKELTKNYPRGSKELLGPFTRFQPKDTIAWFEERGVILKTEDDGRMFPTTDNSETIINCLVSEAKRLGVEILNGFGVEEIKKTDSKFVVTFGEKPAIECQKILLATGSNKKIYTILEQFGHTIQPLVPSLFTFNSPTSPLNELSGISIEKVELSLENSKLKQTGPFLITHFGFSGPAVLKLSAWAAKEFFACNYKTKLFVNFLPDLSSEKIMQTLQKMKESDPTKMVSSQALFFLPKNLWKKLVELAGIGFEERYATISHKKLELLTNLLHKSTFEIDGKTTYKQEFVTCGGVSLPEVNFKTMESKIVPGLYFAGEVLDIDGVTGGFNFQNAWTTSFLAAQALAT